MKALFLILAAFFFSCSELYIVPEVHYIIAKGKHASALDNGSAVDKIRSLKQDRLEFVARFDASARYDLGNDNQHDINKLMGFSEANSYHQENSIRFGWRYLKDQDRVEILAYAYKDGIRSYERIAEVEIDQDVVYRIVIYERSFYLEVDGVSIEVERVVGEQKGLYYMLYPYFGGDEKAPHDIHIYIKELFG